MAKLPSLVQEGCHASECRHLKDSGVGDSAVLPFDVQDLSKTINECDLACKGV